MEPTDIMDLYFTKYDTYQNLWLIYCTAFFGLIAYVSSRPQFIKDKKKMVVACFCVFAMANGYTLLKNKSDIENLKSAATVTIVADNEQLVRSYLLPVVDNEYRPGDYIANHWKIFVFHLIFDGIMIYILMTVGIKEVTKT